jgi:hypothetical protein
MAMYPDSLAVSIPPMSWPTNVIRAIPNRDYDRASSIIWPRTVTIVRSVITWVSAVIAFTAYSPEQG